MNTYFARHSGKLDLDDATLQRLRERQFVAIHFPWEKTATDDVPDSESLDVARYGRAAKSALGAMIELAQNGGYVCATYRDTKSVLIGKVLPDSKIELVREHWGSDNSRPAVLKALKLVAAMEVPPAKQALLLSMAPQQGTFCRWHRVGRKVMQLVEGEEWAMELDALHSVYQEVMCSEFLRNHDLLEVPRLHHLLLPVGRTMKGVDIFGVAEDGKTILAQVTFGSSPAKLEELAGYGTRGTNHLIYFCDAETVHLVGDVIVVPLKYVFESFSSTSRGMRWLEAAHNFL